MKNVMVRAWEIAKEATVKFGGKAKQYFRQALIIAWAEHRQPQQTVSFETTTGSRKHKSWVARITSVGGKYNFGRDFINTYKNTGAAHVYTLTDGFYHISTAGENFYIEVVNGDWDYVEANEITL